MTSAVTASRFDVVRRLGEGTTGVVYEAIDRESGVRVALKTLRNVTTESTARLEREFRALQTVRHPNLVTLGEFVCEGGQSLLTMELVEGTDFLEYVRPADRAGREPPFDEPRLRDALGQLAEGLSALHDAGLVHRDVKPSNVRVTPEGRVVLLDFGLVIDATADDPWMQSAAGTPRYMAPEQAVSGQVGPEADWYATGVLLFEALTGRAPFEGPPLQVVTRKQKEEPPASSAVARGVPADLDALCAALLRFDPASRPQGRHVLRALSSRAGPSVRYASQTQETPFVGRADELEALAAALRDNRMGHPVVVVLEGASGIGKTALVERFAQRVAVEDPEAVVLASRCYGESPRPFQGFVGIVEGLATLLARLDMSEAGAIVPARPQALVKMFPVLRRVEAITERARGSQPVSLTLVGLRTRAFEGFRELLRGVGNRRSLVLVIDDAQWIDAESASLLADLMRPPHAPRLLLVVATEASVPSVPGDLRRIGLGPLRPEDGHALAAATLQRTDNADPGLADRCVRRAGGDPFAIGVITLHLEHVRWDMEDDATAKGVIGRVILQLGEAERVLLETVAIAAAPLAADTIERATAIGANDFRRAASTLRVLHLVRGGATPNAGRIEPYHDRVATAVVALLDGPRRAELHRRVAVALETSETSDFPALATHWAGAGDRTQTAHYAALAGDQAVERLEFERAACLYELALSDNRSPDDARRALLIKLAEARANAGLGEAASEAFTLAAEGASGSQGLDLRRRAAEELLMIGDIEAGTRKVRDVTGSVGVWMPSSPVMTIVALLLFRLSLWARGMRYAPRDAESTPAKEITRIWVCAGVARTLSMIDIALAAYFQTRMLLFALRAGSANELSYALAYEAAFTGARGVLTRARTDELLALAEMLAEKSGVPRAKTTTATMTAFVAHMQGRNTDAIEAYECARAQALDHSTSNLAALRQMQLISLSARADIGEVREVSAELRDLLHEAMDRGDLATSTAVRIQPYFWRAWLRDGDPKEIRAGIEETMRRWSSGRYLSQHHWACGALTELDLYEGRGRDAFERIARDFPRARRARRFAVERNHVVARERRARCAILAAAQEGRPKERARLLAVAERDARWLRCAPPDYAKAWAAVVEAGVRAVRGDDSRAAAALKEAVEGFDATCDRFAAACARLRLGALLGREDAGSRWIEAGEAFMREQGVVDPHRMATAVLPGFAR
jgi:hypothetical protein